MALLLINHATVWGSPVTCLRRSASSIRIDTSTSSAPPCEWQQQLAQGRCLTPHKPIHSILQVITRPLVNFWKRAPSTVAACTGAAAAAASIPVMKAALKIGNVRVPRPWSSPFAFLGHVYVLVYIFEHLEVLLLRSPTFRDTALRHDYLEFYDWFAQRTGMTVTRDVIGVPHTTLISTFVGNLGADRMSATVFDRGPTLWQLFFPNLLHFQLFHLFCSTTSVWSIDAIVASSAFKARLMIVLLAGGTMVNSLTWITARRTVLRLPVSDQNPVAIHRLIKDLEYRSSEAWSGFKGNLRRGQLGYAWASFRHFILFSCRYALLNDLNPGVGASSGLAAMFGYLISFRPYGRESIIKTVIGPVIVDLSQDHWTHYAEAQVVGELLRRWQDAVIAEFPFLTDVLRPTLLHSLVALNLLRIVQWWLALSPRVGHQVHVLGSVSGFVLGLLSQWARRALHARRAVSAP